MTSATLAPAPGLELWGGVECTFNRVRDRFFDQLRWNGHDRRATDLDLLAWAGFQAVRYPVLWERTAPAGLETADWAWPDARLGRLRQLGIRPIVGLLHHGSGPEGTSLVDPAFPEKLAAYAGAVARRYPFVQDWTPINEILTTARFSTLYGHWYPHGRDDRLFVRAVLQQCRGTALAMRAIRQVNPDARLIQTDDFGWTSGGPGLAAQVRFENARRVLALDLLTGRVDPRHPLWRFLLRHGACEEELFAFQEAPCPPDIIGLNHYLTSDRWLDEDLRPYPAGFHGGNGRQRYADVEAVRTGAGRVSGHAALLQALWSRFRRPLAITEVHLGCSREEQLRWLAEAYRAAAQAREAGVDVRAVTAWALFGSFHWDRLVTSDDGHYEPGLFDVRADPPRPTLVARAARQLAHQRPFSHPVLAAPGWWHRSDRQLYPPTRPAGAAPPPGAGVAPLLITGGTGTLGRALGRVAARRGLAVWLLSRGELDISHGPSIRQALERVQPWAVINAAGYVRVDDAESEPQRCYRENVDGPRLLAEACAAHGVGLATFSSDLVFDGSARRPYLEGAALAPLGVYGISKAWAEAAVSAAMPSALLIRTAAFFSPWDEHNYVSRVIRELSAGRSVDAADDLVVSPTYVPDLAEAALDLLLDQEAGIWHLANEGALSWKELACSTAKLFDLDERLVRGRPSHELGFRAARPAFSALGSERGQHLRPLSEALASLRQAHQPAQPEPAAALGTAA
jgi:dTDP-4-dehydrorhamnose reductase